MQTLRKVLEECSKQGFQTILDSYQAILVYLDQSSKISTFKIHTDAEIVNLAVIYENLEFQKSNRYDAFLSDGELNIAFICDLKRESRQFSPVSSKKSFKMEPQLLYSPTEDKYFTTKSAYKLLKERCIEFDGLPDLMQYGEMLALVYELGFKLSPKCKMPSIREIHSPEPDEVRALLEFLLTGQRRYEKLCFADSSGLLKKLLPELYSMQGVFQDKDHHPEGDVFTHTLECFKHFTGKDLMTSLALLLHDIGKPETESRDAERKFYGHANRGAIISSKILKKLEFPPQMIEEIFFLISHHLLAREIARRDSSERIKFMQHPLFSNLLKLYKADICSCYGDLKGYSEIVAAYKKIKDYNS